MLRHKMLSGETIEAPAPTGALAAFLSRLRSAVTDPTVDEHAFVELLYSTENPLLDHTIMPGRGTVTKAVFADPLYHVMIDLLGRKRVELGTLDMDKVRARYSMSVKEAAAKKGVHETAIRQAIAAKRLSSVKDKGQHWLDPAQVDAWKPAGHGPAAPLRVVYGSAIGRRLSIKHDGELIEEEADGNLKTGRIEGWTRAAILAGTKERVRFWVIEPGATVDELVFEPFEVSGRFSIVEKFNNETQAREAFKEFAPNAERIQKIHEGVDVGTTQKRPDNAPTRVRVIGSEGGRVTGRNVTDRGLPRGRRAR